MNDHGMYLTPRKQAQTEVTSVAECQWASDGQRENEPETIPDLTGMTAIAVSTLALESEPPGRLQPG
jgi:hypothetical protein